MAGDGARLARLAWLASFLATLSLVAILAMAKSAQASTNVAPGASAATAVADPPFDVESEGEDEGGEDGEFELEECEEDEADCEEEGGPEAPSECVLSTVKATVFASPAQSKVRLVVRYTAAAPAVVAIDYGLHGSKGSLFLGQSKKHFSKTGVFHQTESLSEPQMAKASGAKDFTVQLYAVNAPHYCRHYFDKHLTARRAAPSGLTWADPAATLRR